nr:MAG TPA: hypothetical protein [Caudoviricetes sp.]
MYRGLNIWTFDSKIYGFFATVSYFFDTVDLLIYLKPKSRNPSILGALRLLLQKMGNFVIQYSVEVT